MPPAPELKATLTLPQTAFPMKANLPQNEPLRLARWASLGLYERLRKAGVVMEESGGESRSDQDRPLSGRDIGSGGVTVPP